MQKYSNYELNGFLTTLMEDWDELAAQAVIDSFHTLSIASNYVKIRRETKNDASVTGHTNEAGNVSVHNEEVQETITGENENERARVGYYKIRNNKYQNGSVITWQHYWAADPTTESLDKAPPPTFGLEYNPGTLKPIALLRWDWFKEENPHFSPRVLMTLTLSFLRHLFQGRFLVGKVVSYQAWPTTLFGKSNLKAVR